jgi:hypothetical protein
MDEQDKIAGRKASLAAAKAASDAAKAPKSSEFRGTASAVKKSSVKPKAKAVVKAVAKVESAGMTRPGSTVKAVVKSAAPGAISGKMKSTATSKSKSSAPSSISGKKVATTSKKTTTKKTSAANGLPGVKRGGSSSMKFGINFDKIQARFGANSPADNAARKAKGKEPRVDTRANVVATMAKRMGISVAEYNRRAAVAKAKYNANKK